MSDGVGGGGVLCVLARAGSGSDFFFSFSLDGLIVIAWRRGVFAIAMDGRKVVAWQPGYVGYDWERKVETGIMAVTIPALGTIIGRLRPILNRLSLCVAVYTINVGVHFTAIFACEQVEGAQAPVALVLVSLPLSSVLCRTRMSSSS